MTKLFNYDPYFDDFDEDKNFMRVLFRPGYSVQARELTQLQTILSNQIEKFGNHIFKNGSPITGGKVSLDNRAYYLILKPQYSNEDIVLENFLNKTIVSYNSSKVIRAKVIAIDNTTTSPVLVVKYLSGDFFAEGDELKVYGQNIFAELADESAVGRSYVANIQEGVYYFRGQFVKVNPQFLVLELFHIKGLNTTTINKEPSYKIGIEFDELTIDEIDDITLLDPAQASFNYQAPGANRFKITTTLSKRALDSFDESSFFEVIRIVDGVKTKEVEYPIYSEIEKTLARRTYEESGNYTVDPFVLSLEEEYVETSNNNYVNPNYFSAILDPGKAYVSGYEVQTIAPTRLQLARARQTANIVDYEVPLNYSSYIYTANTHGSLDISGFKLLDIHCCQHSGVSFATDTEYNSSKIGTLRAHMLKYDTSTSSDVGSSHIFTVNVFDVNSSSIVGYLLSSGSTNTIVALPTSFAQLPANSYAGMYFSIKDGAGASLAPIKIDSSSGSAKTITLSSALPFTPSSNLFSIDSDFKTANSIISRNSSSKLFAADIDNKSKVDGFGTAITEPNRQKLIFDVPFDAIKNNSISNFDFYARKVYSNKISNAGGVVTLATSGTDTFPFAGSPGTLSDSIILNNITCFIRYDSTSNSTSGITPNTVLSLANNLFTVTAINDSTIEIDFDTAGVRADFIVTTKVNNAEDGTNGAIRVKQLYPLDVSKHEKIAYNIDPTNGLTSANTGTIVPVSGLGYVYPDLGVTAFTDISILEKLKTPGVPVSLQVPDVYEIVKIIDSKSLTGNVITSQITDSSFDVTNRYEFDNGQKTTHYDHATIKLKRGFSSPTGGVIYVMYKYLKHSQAPSPQNIGLFTVDSYLGTGSNITYDNISRFADKLNGKLVSGRSSFDFRPTREIAGNNLSGAVCPDPDYTAELSFENYLPRIDKIVVKPSKEIVVLEGKSAIKPLPPPSELTDMLLYTLYIPPYTESVKEIRADFQNNRRFTMRDIGAFENRIRGLEYYVALNSLEKNANDSKVLDANGLERSKYGILVDNFTTRDAQSTYSDDGFDNRNKVENGELKPASLMRTIKLLWSESGSSGNYRVMGTSGQKSLIMNYDSTQVFASQPYATKTVPVASALFGNFNGNLRLFPEYTSEHDTGVTSRTVLNSFEGLENAFNFINDAFQFVSDKNPTWLLDKDNPFAKVSDQSWFETKQDIQNTEVVNPENRGKNWRGNLQTTTDQLQIKTGATFDQTKINVKATEVDRGSFITDISINPYLKPRGIVFYGSALRPRTRFYSFFDDVLVDNYTIVPTTVTIITSDNKLKSGEMILIADSTAQLSTDKGNYDTDSGSYNLGVCVISEPTPASAGLPVVRIIHESNVSLNGKFIRGLDCGLDYQIASVIDHRCGQTRGVSSSSITLAADAPSVDLSGKTINLVRETVTGADTRVSSDPNGVGLKYTISSYNTTTKVATISGSIPTTVAGKTYSYSLDTNVSNEYGQVGGLFYPPEATFRSGERTYRLTESFNNTYDKDAISFADRSFVSSGVTTQKTTLVDTVYNVGTSTQVSGPTTSPLLLKTSTTSTITKYWKVDPLAQTFYVDEESYPHGLYLESVNLFFSAKDDEGLPVRIQIRPTVNGTPSFNYWYPESVVEKFPRDIVVTTTPSVDVESSKNKFTFESPVFLKPGLYALVILTDSPDYVVWTAEKGQTTLSNQNVSVNPYVGTLYKSQNAMEYVPYLNEDLMFELNRCVFNTGTAVFTLQSERQLFKRYIDRFRLLETSIKTQSESPISINYSFVSTPIGGSKETVYRNIVPSLIYDMSEDTLYSVGNRRKEILNKNDFTIKLEMSTNNDSVTPLVSLESLSLNAWENFIDNGDINSEDFNIVKSGGGYANSNTITITSTTGEGALVFMSCDGVNGNVLSANVVSSGLGYLDDFTISFPDTGNTPNVTSNAVITLNSEFDSSGGPCLAKYITKPIVLADGFDAGDLRVYLTANKPVGTEVHVFYKILSGSDITGFRDRPYGKFECLNPTLNPSIDTNEFREYEYRPSLTKDEVNYTSPDGVTYDTFKTFSIKIVMTSQDPSVIPRVRDLRVIALPAG